MKNTALKLARAAACVLALPAAALSLQEGFRNPPASAKPHTWYHMMNGNVTKGGITYDFEAIAKAGLGGVQMFDAGCDIPAGPLKFNTEAWFDMFRHAQKEAKRLGLEICIPNCSGWSSSGGPWNTPANAMKTVTSTETPVKGPGRVKVKLPRTAKDHGFYEDIAVLAYPEPRKGASLPGIGGKAGFSRRVQGRSEAKFPADQLVAKSDIIDLSGKMSPDGTLEWNAPAGNWIVLRIGYACNGRCNHPASEKGRGLEVDKLSAKAMDWHFSQYVSRLCRDLGISAATDNTTGFNNILVDSYEVGCQNWTQGLDAIFEKRMGYSIKPYLPVIAGRVVGSAEESERFLEDFRRLLADLFAENYSGRLVKLCHDNGLMCSIEPYGNSNAEDLQYGECVDVPMGEFWSDGRPQLANLDMAPSLAHVWGRRYAAAESFTAGPGGGRWCNTPYKIKALGDQVYCKGINRVIYHRFVHQPWPGNKYVPGMTMGRWGMHMDRTQTWWHLAPAWFMYQTRCQWMLQEGRYAADVLYWTGEQAPNDCRPKVDLPAGYAWDYCATKAVETLKVRNGKIVVPGGTEYSLLVLPETDTMSEKAVRRIGELIDAGAKVSARRRPVRAPGLRGWPASDERLRAAVAETWAKGVMECTPAEALARIGVKPDFYTQKKGASWIHRRDGNADWYFVALDNEIEETLDASFRISGRAPELWNPETGETVPAPLWLDEDGRTIVSLNMKPRGSVFVVFRDKPAPRHAVSVTASSTFRPDPGEKTAHKLEILRAVYGVMQFNMRPGCREVSTRLKPGVSVRVSNEAMGGDPCMGKVKELEVVYVKDGRRKTERVRESGVFLLPSGAKVESAWYGVIDPAWKNPPVATMDIAGRLAVHVRNGSVDVTIGNDLAGRDPAYQTPKVAEITYVYDGETNTVRLAEDERFKVPAVRERLQPPPVWEWRGNDLLAWQPMKAELAFPGGATEKVAAEPRPAVAVKGAWTVSFPPGWEAPAKAEFPVLSSWDKNMDLGIKYFSGTATYRKRAVIPELKTRKPGERVMLDLGEVKNFAAVNVNGKEYPALWRSPFRLDITDAVDPATGVLDMEIKVTNLWANRLIGDDRLYEDDCRWWGEFRRKGPKEAPIRGIPQWVKQGKSSPTHRHTFTTFKHWNKEDDTLPSGLLGPVCVRFGEIAR